MAVILIDSCIVIDLADPESAWFKWSASTLEQLDQLNDYKSIYDNKKIIEENNSISYQLAESKHSVSSIKAKLDAARSTISEKEYNIEKLNEIKAKLDDAMLQKDTIRRENNLLKMNRRETENILLTQISELKTLLKNSENENLRMNSLILEYENKKCADESEGISAIGFTWIWIISVFLSNYYG